MSISWKASLPIRAAGHVAGDRDHRHRVEEGRPDPGDEVGRARTGRAHAHPDPAGHPGVAVGGVGAALLVADEDVAELRVVAEDVVQRQDHAARVAEEDVDALAQQRLAQDVRPDAGALEVARLVEHPLRARSTAAASAVPSFGHVAPPGRGRRGLGRGSPGRSSDRHRSGLTCIRSSDKQKTLASRRGSFRCFGGSCASASSLRVPRFSRREPVMSPRRPSSPGSERMKGEERYVDERVGLDRARGRGGHPSS